MVLLSLENTHILLFSQFVICNRRNVSVKNGVEKLKTNIFQVSLP